MNDMNGKNIVPIAHIETDFREKFGIPRQPLQVPGLEGRIVFTPEYRHPDALKGLEAFSHLWLIWDFSENDNSVFHATVKPPRLGGKTHVGVFASRAPFRPNGLGLSVVKLIRIESTENQGQILIVEGADLMNGTPIFDIKPYVPVADCQVEATDGYTEITKGHRLQVIFPQEELDKVPLKKQGALIEVLAQDPRPRYGVDSSRVYGVYFSDMNIRFTVLGDNLKVVDVVKC